MVDPADIKSGFVPFSVVALQKSLQLIPKFPILKGDFLKVICHQLFPEGCFR
jgi:hypothetical protein